MNLLSVRLDVVQHCQGSRRVCNGLHGAACDFQTLPLTLQPVHAVHTNDLAVQLHLHRSSRVEHCRLGQVSGFPARLSVQLLIISTSSSIFPLALLIFGHVLYAFVLNPTVMGMRF